MTVKDLVGGVGEVVEEVEGGGEAEADRMPVTLVTVTLVA